MTPPVADLDLGLPAQESGQDHLPGTAQPTEGVREPQAMFHLAVVEELSSQRQLSMLEDTRGLINWVQAIPIGEGSDLGHLPDTTFDETPRPSTMTQPFENTPAFSEQVAAAAMLAPVLLDDYVQANENAEVCIQMPFQRAIVGPIVLLVVLTCALMHGALETSAAVMRTEAIRSCDTILSTQKALVQSLVQDNVTAGFFGHHLGQLHQAIDQHVKVPAERAVQAISSSISTNLYLNSSWTGRSEDQRSWLAYRAWVELDRQWGLGALAPGPGPIKPLPRAVSSISVSFSTGELAAVALSTHTVECPQAGPAACGSCKGLCSAMDLWSMDAPAGQDGRTTLTYWKMDPQTGDMLDLLNREDRQISSDPALAVQQEMVLQAQQAPSGMSSVPATKLWSHLQPMTHGEWKISRTVPITPCGDYSCFEGAVSADIVLTGISEDCWAEWTKLKLRLPVPSVGVTIGPLNASVFIVNHISERFPDQQGILVGSSSYHESAAFGGEPQGGAADSSDEVVRATARALLAKYGRWDAEALKEPQLFTFSRTRALAGEYQACSESSAVSFDHWDKDCLEVGTLSMEFDKGTRWLAVAVLPNRAFDSTSFEQALFADQQVALLKSVSQDRINQARITAGNIFVLIATFSIGIGLALGKIVTEPLQSLCNDMKQLGVLDLDSPGITKLRLGHRARISNIAELQGSLCRLLHGIEAFSRFVPETVVQRIVSGDRRATRLHVDKRDVTIMFCCMENFAQVRDNLSEDETLRIMIRFHTVMTQVVEQFQGAVAEILDDGLLVYWNTPDTVTNHAARACEAALAQQRAMELLNIELRESGLMCLQACTGIHTGNVLCGNIGSDMKMKFGCVGDSMNLTSRLQGLCKYYGVGVICSDATYAALPQSAGLLCRKLDLVMVKGRREPTPVYEVIGRLHGRYDSLDAVQQAVDALRIANADAAAGPPMVWPADYSPTEEMNSTARTPAGARFARTFGPARRDSEARSPPARGTPPAAQLWFAEPARGWPGACSPAPDTPGARRSPTAAPTPTILGAAFGLSPTSQSPGPMSSPRDIGGATTRTSFASFTSVAASVLSEELVTPEQQELARQYEQALQAYQEARFSEAREQAITLVQSRPDDTASQRLLERASHYSGLHADNVIPETWTGVTRMTEK